MAIPGLSLSDGSVSQTIDLYKEFGVDFNGREALKLALCQSIVDYMRKRTLSGVDVNGEAFAPYSEEYKESKEFEAYGKSNKVNMKLSGDMLAAIDFETEGNSVTFLFDDIEDEEKAYGHMTGMEGHPVLDGKVSARLFFGITEKDLKEKILPKFKEDFDAINVKPEEFITLEEAFASVSLGQSSERTLDDLLGEL